MRPLKIAVLHSETNSSFVVRCQTPLLWLKEQRAIEVLPQEKAWEADLVFLHGMQGWPGSLAMVRSLKRNGIRVIADLDGDVLPDHELPPEARPIAAMSREFWGTVDALTAATEPLAKTLEGLNPAILVTPNGINLKAWPQSDKFAVRKQVAQGRIRRYAHTRR